MASVGQQAEDAALDYLRGQGLSLIERNYRCRLGEIDLIMRDAGILVFVEVRFRSSQSFGGALESVDRHKRLKICKAASFYLNDKRIDCPCRFDIVALSPQGDGLKVQWIKDAFQVET